MNSLFLAVLMVLFVSGCGATISGTIRPLTDQLATGSLRAGAAKVDITPPPGYPMGGHSIAGQISRGQWLRLFARSIFLEDREGSRVVLVSADLWSIPAGLADRVAELNSHGPAACTVGRTGLILAATHTHQSPGNFSSSALYNAFASPVAGFDPGLFEFLAGRIASSVEQSCLHRRKARISYTAGRITRQAFARNRSFSAFLNDPEAETVLRENADLPVGPEVAEYPFPESYRAIDPTLRVLHIREALPGSRDIAIAAFVAVHATSLTHEAEVYSSDLFGVAALTAERRLSTMAGDGAPSAVVAIFNGAEGDISPAWIRQDRRDTLSLGKDLAENILSMGPERLIEGRVGYQFSVEGLAGKCLPEAQGKTLCTDTDPVAGVATLGGAEDGRTVFYQFGWREGIKGHSNEAQNPKQPALDLPLPFPSSLSPTRIIGKIATAPKATPIGVYEFGPLALATLPGEFTMVLGRRITAEVNDSLKDRVEDVILIGLANEYVSYFTTPEEYEQQSYEGASMLYGKAAGAYVGHELGLLADKLRRGEPYRQADMHYRFHAGPVRRFGIGDLQATVPFFVDKGLSSILEDTATGESILSSTPAFCWSDRPVDLPEAGQAGTGPTPRVALVTRAGGRQGWAPIEVGECPEDDGGTDFVTVVVRPGEDLTTWCTFWMPGKDLRGETMSFRFSVLTPSGKTVLSPECVLQGGAVNEACRFDQGRMPVDVGQP